MSPADQTTDRAELLARLCLLKLKKMSPSRARWLTGAGAAAPAIEALRQGRLPDGLGPAPKGLDRDIVTQWADQLRSLNGEALLELHRSLNIEVLGPGDPRWPFDEDPEPPTLLFFRGELGLLQLAAGLAIVGTRRCTSIGRTVAYQIGAEVAAAGVAVVSGLALGIDGAAHRGALDNGGPVIGVVGSGLDVVYPGANRGLWEEVGERGLLLSEAPAQARPERWRFPARNRLIAGLSEAVLVVESHRRGGALLTVDEAVDRGKPVFAVPGSVLSPASDGTNELLIEGAIPARHAADVLGHLGLELSSELQEAVVADPSPPSGPQAVPSPPTEPRPTIDDGRPTNLSPLAEAILAEVVAGPTHMDRLIQSTGQPAPLVLAEVQSLVSAGRLLLDGSTVTLP